MNRLGGARQNTGPVRWRVAPVRVPLSAVVASWLARRTSALVVWVVKHPPVIGALVALLALWRAGTAVGVLPLVLAALVAAVGLAAWHRLHPPSFTRLVAWRLRGWWRAVRVYRFVWQPAMVTTGLAVTVDTAEYLPKLLRVRSTGSVDEVAVRMLPGQTIDDWTRVAPGLAQTFGVLECRVRSVAGRPRSLVLWFLVSDPLAALVPRLTEPDAVDLAALPVGRQEDGQPYQLRLLGTHLLLAGATGAGKSQAVWALLFALIPGIRSGLVQVWAIDPKGGMELAPGAPLFARFCHGGDTDDGTGWETGFAVLLEDAVAVMRRRQEVLRGVTRLHTPTDVEPLIVVIVDELASLTGYVTDRDAKRRIASALGLLLSQGRAVGVTVVGAVQDPRKDILPMRDLFPTRILLRCAESDHVALVLGQGARDRGALADRIPETLPGVGYVQLDGIAEPVRIRFTHITDTDIAAVSPRAAHVAWRPSALPVTAPRQALDRDAA